MTKDPNDTPPPHDPDSPDGAPAEPPRPRRRGRALRVAGWTLAVLVLLVVLALALVYAAATTERGTRLAWQTAVRVLGGRLAGTLEGGALATGVRLRDVAWTSPGGAGTEVRVDRLDGRWALTRAPLRLSIAYLRAGTIDVRIAPGPSTPSAAPQDLRLPLQLRIGDLRIDHLAIHEGASTTQLDRIALNGHSDGRHHELALDSIDTPYGSLTARAKLDGMKPFALTGDATYAGKFADEPVDARARVSGSLEALVADVDASGMKLNGRAHVEAAPFGTVPLTRASLAFDHVNPKAISPSAPAADLAVRAALEPVTAPAGAAQPHGFAVTGPVSIVNAKPGTLGDHLLPVVDAHATVHLDAHAQRIDGLALKLIRDGRVTGGGTLSGGKGRFDLKVANLDLNAFVAALRPMRLGGPLGVTLAGDATTVDFDLTDPKLALGARAKVALTAQQTVISEARVTAGKGRIDLTGAFRHDAHSSYDAKATLTAFDPLLLAAASAPTAGAGKAPAKGKAPAGRGDTRVNGTLTASGAFAPQLSTKATFKLGDSVYDGVPLTGAGVVQLAGTRILPSNANLSIAGNRVDLHGSFGAPGDRLNFVVDAPQLDRLGFGVQGLVQAQGDLTGSFAHPNVTATYKAEHVVVGSNRIGAAQGRADIRDGAHGALVFTADASDIALGSLQLKSLRANLDGTRAKHTFDASALGAAGGRVIDMTLAANGGVTEGRDGMRWDGTVTRLANRGTPAVALQTPLTVSAGTGRVTLGAARLTLEGAAIDLKSFVFDHGQIRSAGAVSGASVARFLEVRQELTGERPPVRTDVVLDADWDFSLGATATGYLQMKRRGGDVTIETGRGIASLGLTDLSARAAFGPGNRVNVTAAAKANRIGTLDANVAVPLAPRDGVLAVADDGPLSGRIDADIPSLKATGNLFGPSYLLGGRAALKLTVAGTPAKPNVSGMLTGDDLSATLVDQGVQLKDGVVRVRLAENLVEFQQVEFHGGDGTLRALGRVRLDGEAPDLTASIVADKLELFAAPDRKLSLSGKATVANDGPRGALSIDGKFVVDRALFDLPEESAPHLSDDVVIVRPDGTVRGETQTGTAAAKPQKAADKPAPSLAPRANIDIGLGDNFRFKGHGADLGLRGTITVMSAPGVPLRAIGNVRVTEGSTYTSFGRKLAIENGFFTFNGPVSNPGVNILAMRRNQEVEAGVQVTGTIQSPTVKLVSEPNVTDNEKLSWLLFGHGTDQGNNIGQQNTMTAALALLGSATGKRVAQTFGLDEFSIGRSDVGLTDPQVVQISKAINERFVLGYEQGLQSASNAFKATINLTRFWSVSAYGGTFQGVDLNYTRRFDRWFGRR
ncbi:TPA: translocation/assembly module TamB domain-containing protein [Burkholderia multivorans]|uniref:translocation/assembly module TamB domain-containing protein n=1 Tax=Burkholderia multivorans TaxID=87883 RepID=UPI001C21EDF2|nr:translocation/assembly module TamB domain-containing protein [Burkholderia multivorans]MBU9350687.1 translocation/assembly module TamB domain-containing protein [Burkholderia multivorans]MBU9397432.1 translocation/assembly module TamB domain-containing protein [Burkholderia multivorans]HDR9835931.1 translocation/assembly module TamB domain-containing protein [Burkholderia multivorans]HDR9842158.1 translocation/assembly module TamB domain-containing protein [Burkholderia multivorans]HDR98490